MKKNFIFTITTGRSGQATLHKILKKFTLNCYSEFEAPSINPIFPFFLGDIEKKIRRKFIETNELLGRGKIITAYENNDIGYITKIAKRRLVLIERKMENLQVDNYFDVSKFYIRGLYKGFNRMLNSVSLVFLVRDPLLNMKSFYNRKKNFLLDNSLPSAKSNLLRIDIKDLSKKELYLWSWAEIFLRYKKISKSTKTSKAIMFKTEDLHSPEKIKKLFNFLNIKHTKINVIKKINTNEESGITKTIIEKDDLILLKDFIKKIPSYNIDLIRELKLSLKNNHIY
ncbi:MAG: hypothetical protein CBD69_003845 [Crocinitomicaceae bacterium TMED209]|nr:MAG: hypothetical protein CBD69_003845 [Crocinitomicaceae bacterium TMED209]